MKYVSYRLREINDFDLILIYTLRGFKSATGNLCFNPSVKTCI